MAPLRIAHLTATYPPYHGGAGTACANLARGLAARGHEVHVHTAHAPGAPPPEPPGVTVHRHRPRLAIGNAPLIPALAHLRDFDVLHVHYPFIFGTELVRRARRHNGPLVLSHHNELIGDGLRRPLFWAYERTAGRAAARMADRVTVLSEAHAETVPALRGTATDVLPNGVDVDAFTPGRAEALRARLGIAPDAPVAVFVSALDRAHHLKRPDLALEVARRVEGLHLLVAGDGEWRARCEAAAPPGRTHFLGALGHDRLPEALRAADALLMPSDRESFGIVLLEAMACGVPTVSTDPPGVRAVVHAGDTGLLAPVGDSDALAARLRELLALAPERRAAMGAAGRTLCERRYAWPRLAERLETIYEQAGAATAPR